MATIVSCSHDGSLVAVAAAGRCVLTIIDGLHGNVVRGLSSEQLLGKVQHCKDKDGSSCGDDTSGGDTTDEDGGKQEPYSSAEKSPFFIRAMAWHSDLPLLAISDSLKNLFVMDLSLAQTTSLGAKWAIKMPKAVTRLSWVNDEMAILVGDKFGDLHAIDVKRERDESREGSFLCLSGPHLLLGHISILTDFALDKDKQYVYTAQRDQKIKKSLYRHPDVIKTYILGHSEYISSICLSSDGALLVSGGGDDFVMVTFIDDGDRSVKIHLTDIVNGNGHPHKVKDLVKIVGIGGCLVGFFFERGRHFYIVKIEKNGCGGVETVPVQAIFVGDVEEDGWISDVEHKNGCLWIGVFSSSPKLLKYEKSADQTVYLVTKDLLLCGDKDRDPRGVVPDYLSRHTMRRGYDFQEKMKTKNGRKKSKE